MKSKKSLERDKKLKAIEEKINNIYKEYNGNIPKKLENKLIREYLNVIIIEASKLDPDPNLELCKSMYYLLSHKTDKDKLIYVLEYDYKILHKQGGRKPKLTMEDKLDMTLEYMLGNIYNKSLSYKELSYKYKIHESNICEIISWIISVLEKRKIITETEALEETEYEINLQTLNEEYNKLKNES